MAETEEIPETNIEIRTAEWFVNTVMRDVVANNERRVWILGAGASKDSGIPMAAELAKNWAKEAFGLENGTDEELANRLKTLKESEGKDWNISCLDRHYFEIYDYRFGSLNSGYADLLERLKDKTPSYGYFILAHLLSHTQSNLAITVNFDNLIADAIYLAGDGYPMILDHEGVAHLANPMTSVPMVCKIHRDLTKHPMSRTAEMANLEPRWEAPMDEIFKYYSPIFLGYGGNDHTLMRCLGARTPDSTWRPIWLAHTESGVIAESDLKVKVNDECYQFLVSNRAIVVPFRGFDELFHLIQLKLLPNVDVLKLCGERTTKINHGLVERVKELADRVKRAPSTDPVARVVNAQSPTTPFDWCLRGLSSDDPDEKIRCFSRAIDLNCTYAFAYYQRGISYALLESYQDAIVDYDQAIALNPDPGTYTFRGIANALLERYDDAISDYDQAIALNANFVDAIVNRAITMFDLKRYEHAISDYDRAIELQPQNWMLINNRGNAKFKLKRFKEAIVDFDRAIFLNPKDAFAHLNRGNAKCGRHRYEEAIRDYDQAIALNSNLATAYFNRGFAKAELNRYEDAISDYDKVIELEPRNVAALIDRGIAKVNLGRFEDAIQDYDLCLSFPPRVVLESGLTRASIISNRCVALANLGRYQEAISGYDDAIVLEPKNVIFYSNRGAAKSKLERFDEAMSDFDRARQIDISHASAYYYKAATYAMMGVAEQAVVELRFAIELDPKRRDRAAGDSAFVGIHEDPAFLALVLE